MRIRILATLAACAVAVVCAFPAAAQAAQPGIAGTWVGELKAGALVLRLVFNISGSPGSWAATMDSPDQGAKGIPVSRVTLDGTQLTLEVAAAAGSFVGALSADGSSVDGAWKQAGQSFPVLLKRQEGAFVLDRPQEPKPPFPYTAVEVSFTSARGAARLSGTLTIPPGKGPFPGVVLVTGSGPQDRDESLLGHKPFLVIADFLARSGIAVLRYDDRGVGRSSGDFAQATTLDFADDAEAAFTYLAARPEVDPRRVGIVGHSEGGLVAPLVASRNASVGFIVLLAGPGLRGDQLLLLQSAALMRASGATEEQIAAARKLNETLYAIAIQESDPVVIRDKARAVVLDTIAAEPSLTDAQKSEARQGVDAQLAQLSTPWFRTFLSLDPAASLSKVRIPVLALNGSLDLQVPVDEDLGAIETALKAAGNTHYRVVKLDGLNHLFQHAKSGLPEEYGTISETFSAEALAMIRDFILSAR